MTVTLDQVREVLDADGVRYYLDPRRPVVLSMFSGYFGDYQITFSVELDGRFLQLRTLAYGRCPQDHPHARAVLELLGEMNFATRTVKFGWDPSDGEIVAYADLWLEDAALTASQLQANLGTLLRTADRGWGRLTQVLATGVDPGPDVKPADQPAEPADDPAEDPSDFDTV